MFLFNRHVVAKGSNTDKQHLLSFPFVYVALCGHVSTFARQTKKFSSKTDCRRCASIGHRTRGRA
jgi:hypothetical protein